MGCQCQKPFVRLWNGTSSVAEFGEWRIALAKPVGAAGQNRGSLELCKVTEQRELKAACGDTGVHPLLG